MIAGAMLFAAGAAFLMFATCVAAGAADDRIDEAFSRPRSPRVPRDPPA